MTYLSKITSISKRAIMGARVEPTMQANNQTIVKNQVHGKENNKGQAIEKANNNPQMASLVDIFKVCRHLGFHKGLNVIMLYY